MLDNMLIILWIIFTILGFLSYHAVFEVWYFNLTRGIIAELMWAVIFGAIMTVLSLGFWYVTCIILVIIGLALGAKTKKGFGKLLVRIAFIGTALFIAVVGISLGGFSRKGKDVDAISGAIDFVTSDYSGENGIGVVTDRENPGFEEDEVHEGENYETDEYDEERDDHEQEETAAIETENSTESGTYDMYEGEYRGSYTDAYIEFHAGNPSLAEPIGTVNISDSSGKTYMAKLFDASEGANDWARLGKYDVIFMYTDIDGYTQFLGMYHEDGVLCADHNSEYRNNDILYFEGDSPEVVSNSDAEYILPGSASEYITDADLDRLSPKELTYARNEIYARRGYVFKSSELNEYFLSQPWYEPDESVTIDSLSKIENENAATISKYQKDHGLEYKPQ